MGGVVNYIQVDHIGRPVFATNSAGTTTWTASYLPFGEVRTTTGTPIALRFPGQWFQSEFGLHQNWMRDYDPTSGRYLEADPLGLVDGASIYGYVTQNPGRWKDPTGEESWVCDGMRTLGIPVGDECGIPPDPQQDVEQCHGDTCGPFTNPEARALAELKSGIDKLRHNSSSYCGHDEDGTIWCTCPGRQIFTAELRHDGPHNNLPPDGTPAREHHGCPHWFWRNCDGSKGSITHKEF